MSSKPSPPMNRIPIESKAIRAYLYHRDLEALELEYLNGRVYEYAAVTGEVFNAFLSANSKGTWVNTILKTGPYPCRQIE